MPSAVGVNFVGISVGKLRTLELMKPSLRGEEPVNVEDGGVPAVPAGGRRAGERRRWGRSVGRARKRCSETLSASGVANGSNCVAIEMRPVRVTLLLCPEASSLGGSAALVDPFALLVREGGNGAETTTNGLGA